MTVRGPIKAAGALAAAVVLAALAAPAASAATNPWLSMRVLNQAHQGGEDVNPSNTMYAYATALAEGSDMLELDVHSTSDHQIVVIHNETVDSTTNGTGAIRDMTLADVQSLDAAHWFVPNRGTTHSGAEDDYALRGVRTGQKPPPPGFEPEDFTIPTLREVLDAFPHIPINIEIKGGDNTEKYQVADDLAAMLKDYPDPENLIVVSFEQTAVDRFHAELPQIPTAPGITGDATFLLLGLPLPEGTAALQIPFNFSTDSIGLHLGLPLELNLAQPWVTQRAHAAGVAVQYWEVPENDDAYSQVVSACGDGIMTTRPDRFEDFLNRSGAPRIGGQGGLDSCGNPPPPPEPGCRLGFSKVFAPASGEVVARFERWGDLRSDCAATLSLRTVEKFVSPGAGAREPRAKLKKKCRKTKKTKGKKRLADAAKKKRRCKKRKPKRVAAPVPAQLNLGSANFTAPAGKSGATAIFHLPPAAMQVLREHPGLAAELQLSGTATDASQVVHPW